MGNFQVQKSILILSPLFLLAIRLQVSRVYLVNVILCSSVALIVYNDDVSRSIDFRNALVM